MGGGANNPGAEKTGAPPIFAKLHKQKKPNKNYKKTKFEREKKKNPQNPHPIFLFSLDPPIFFLKTSFLFF